MARLNSKLDEVHGQIFGMKTFLIISEVFIKVRRNTSQKQVMMGTPKPLLSDGQESSWNPRRNNLLCDHCKIVVENYLVNHLIRSTTMLEIMSLLSSRLYLKV